jgi:hypothetical protein
MTRHARPILTAAACLPLVLFGCTRESLRVALDAQRRADDIQQAVFERQQDALRILLFRNLAHQLNAAGKPLSAAQQAALSDAWNERDVLDFWSIQCERAKALRLVGVDMKLFGDQSVIDLLTKAAAARADRAAEALAESAGKSLNPPTGK